MMSLSSSARLAAAAAVVLLASCAEPQTGSAQPDAERASHYFTARMADQFDAIVHIDTTSALTPLERWSRDNYDLPETYPTGV